MIPAVSDRSAAGVCHALGENAALPPLRLYITVATPGGRVRVAERRLPGTGRYCVIEDPAGAVPALCQPE